MNHVFSYTLAIFIILIAIPLFLILWSYINSKCKVVYTQVFVLDNTYFYDGKDVKNLIPIHKIKIQTHIKEKLEQYQTQIDEYKDCIFVPQGMLYEVPKKIKKNRLIKVYCKKGLHYELLKKMDKAIKVSVIYDGNGEDDNEKRVTIKKLM